jgi:hypothetical protein
METGGIWVDGKTLILAAVIRGAFVIGEIFTGQPDTAVTFSMQS